MTMLPMYKKCPICKRTYSWNPDVGRMFCPYCTSIGEIGKTNPLWKIIEDKLKDKKNKKKS